MGSWLVGSAPLSGCPLACLDIELGLQAIPVQLCFLWAEGRQKRGRHTQTSNFQSRHTLGLPEPGFGGPRVDPAVLT